MRNPLLLVFTLFIAALVLAWVVDPQRRAAAAGGVDQLLAQIQLSPALGPALVAADRGDAQPLTAWLSEASRDSRRSLWRALYHCARDRGPHLANGQIDDDRVPYHLYRHRFLAFTAVPLGDTSLEVDSDNLGAYLLVAPPVVPTADDLAKAKALLPRLQAAAGSEHAIWDTIGCVYFRAGDWTAAKSAFDRAVTLAETSKEDGIELHRALYHRRLAAAETNARQSAEQRGTPQPPLDLPAETPVNIHVETP